MLFEHIFLQSIGKQPKQAVFFVNITCEPESKYIFLLHNSMILFIDLINRMETKKTKLKFSISKTTGNIVGYVSRDKFTGVYKGVSENDDCKKE